MIKLTLDNSISNIEGLCVEQHRKLKKLLSYKLDPQAAYFSKGWGAKEKSLLDKKGNFPSGLLNIVDEFCKSLPRQIVDLRKVPTQNTSFKLNLPFQGHSQQIEAADACKRSERGTVSMCTAFGKTATMAILVSMLRVRTLIIVPNLNLKKQLSDSFIAYFGSLKDITIENIDSGNLINERDYDCLIIDESHHVAAKTYRTLNVKAWKGIYYRFFFTATPFRSKDEEQMLMESISGQVVYSVDYHQAVACGAIVPVEAYYCELPKTRVKGIGWPEVYSELVTKNVTRNDLIKSIMSHLFSGGISTLILVKEINHGAAIASGGAFANGISNDCSQLIDWFNEKKLTCLVGTSGVLGEGVDTRPAEYVIIAGLGKSKNAFMQQIGRVLRKYPGKSSGKVILFKDSSHKYTKSHFAAQVKILREVYGVEPVKLDL